MNIYSILQLCGGLAFFLFGMHVMSGSLEKLAGGNLQKILKEVTSNPIKSLFFGAIVTIAIQSSSALTVMLVGLVNSGIMELAQTVGVIMGSNIGTTLTAWILSLSGIESDNLFISMLKPENFSPVIALIGVIMIMGSKKEKRKDVGIIMAGFAVLMYGMQLMSGAVSPLADMPEFTGLLTTFNNPFLGVLVGAVFTGVIQSSAASVGVLQALAMTGAISYSMAIPIIMGQNIGTCVTALLSSVGTNKNAKRAAVVHLMFNVIGVVVLLALLSAVMLYSSYYLGGRSIYLMRRLPDGKQTLRRQVWTVPLLWAVCAAVLGAVVLTLCYAAWCWITPSQCLPTEENIQRVSDAMAALSHSHYYG